MSDKIEKINKYSVIKDKKEILNTLLNFIESITIINEDTIGVSLDKNLVIYNNQNTMCINKGVQVNLSKQIHLNPVIPISELYDNIDNTNKLQEVLMKAHEKEKKRLLELKNKSCNCSKK